MGSTKLDVHTFEKIENGRREAAQRSMDKAGSQGNCAGTLCQGAAARAKRGDLGGARRRKHPKMLIPGRLVDFQVMGERKRVARDPANRNGLKRHLGNDGPVGREIASEVLHQVTPMDCENINFGGILVFPPDRFRARLFRQRYRRPLK